MASNPSRSLLIGACIVIALIVGVTVWNANKQAPAVADPSQAAMGIEANSADLASSDPALRDVWAGRVQPPPRPARQHDGTRSLLLGSAEDRERAKREYEQLGKDLESAHQRQPVDAAWKGATERSMSNIAQGEALESTGFKPADFRSDCRSQSCRISATFDNAADAQDWATMFTTMSGSDFRSARYVTSTTADGKTEIRIYGNRR